MILQVYVIKNLQQEQKLRAISFAIFTLNRRLVDTAYFQIRIVPDVSVTSKFSFMAAYTIIFISPGNEICMYLRTQYFTPTQPGSGVLREYLFFQLMIAKRLIPFAVNCDFLETM